RTYSLWLHRDGYLHFTSADATFGQTWVNTPIGSIKPGQTYNFAGVMDRETSATPATDLKVYLNGELAAQTNLPYVAEKPAVYGSTWYGKRYLVSAYQPPVYPQAVASVNQDLLIGSTSESNAVFSDFVGTIEEVRIWSTVREQKEIAASMNAELTGAENNLVVLWKFDETSGNTAEDSSIYNSYNNEGAILGDWNRPGGRIKVAVGESDGQPVFFSVTSDSPEIELPREGGSFKIVPSGDFQGTAKITISAEDGTMVRPLGGTDQIQFDYTAGANAIYGNKFFDADGDGMRDEGESGLESVTIFLDDNANGVLDPGERVTYTDANGDYAFTDLINDPQYPVTYNVTEISPPGLRPSDGTPTRPVTFDGPDLIAQGVDFGNVANSAPVAVDDAYTTSVDVPLEVLTFEGIVANDLDADLDQLTVMLDSVSEPDHGQLAINPDGSFTYTPDQGYFGPDSFTYVVSDGELTSNIAAVSVTVKLPVVLQGLVTDSPIAGAEVRVFLDGEVIAGPVVTDENGNYQLEINLHELDPDSRLLIVAVKPGTDIRLVSLTITVEELAALSEGDDIITHEETSDLKVTNITTAVFAVMDSDDDGKVDEGEYAAFKEALENNPTEVKEKIRILAGVIKAVIDNNDVQLPDGMGDVLEYVNSVDGDGEDPDAENEALEGFMSTPTGTGEQTYETKVEEADEEMQQDPALAEQWSAWVNAAPEAVDDSYVTNEDTVLTKDAEFGVLSNDSDEDGDELAAVLVDAPSHGTVALNGDGSFTYTPNLNYFGTDSFTYKAGDAETGSEVATVKIEVQPVNDAPEITSLVMDLIAIDENDTITLSGEFTDPDTNNTHTVMVNWGDGTSTPATVNQLTGTFTAMHPYLDDNPTGTPQDSYTISATVTDDDTGSDSASTTVAVNNVVPVLALDAVSAILENGVATLTGTITDPGTLDTFTLVVNWGDGSPVESFSYAAGTTSFNETHQYLDDDPSGTASDIYTIDLTVTDDDTGEGIASTSTNISNVAPVLSDVAATSANENGTVTLTGTITDPGTLDTFTLDVDWGDGSPVESFNYVAGATSFSETHQYLDDDPSGTPSDIYTIDLTVTDDDTGEGIASTSTTINNVAPVLDNLAATAIDENGTTTLTGTITDPGTLDTFTLDVDWGDPLSPGNMEQYTFTAGTTSFELTHHYLDDTPRGTESDDYTIGLTITDDDTGTTSDTATVTVTNVVPVLGSLMATAIDENGTTTLTGTITDPGVLDTFTLDVGWGDPLSPGNLEQYTFAAGTTSFELTHQYLDDNPSGTESDDYTIGLTITDDDTGTTTDTATVTVNNVAPILGELAATAIDENGTTTLTGTITDPGILDTFTLDVNWGDGGPVETFSYPAGTVAFGESHQYLDDDPSGTPSDSYTISLTVTDDDTGTTSDTATVTVNNVAPVLGDLAVTPIDENGTTTLTGTITDPGILDTFTVDVNWGDGSPGETFSYPAGTTSFNETHQYLDDDPSGTASDTYTIDLTVTDDDTGTTSDTETVTVNNVAPVIIELVSSAPTVGDAGPGDLVSVSSTFSDIGTLDTHIATIDWGDGTTSTAVIPEANGAGWLSGDHIYTSGGIYTITVSLHDDDSATVMGSTQALVTGVRIHNGVLQIVGTAGQDDVAVKAKGKHRELIEVKAKFLPDRGHKRTFHIDEIDSLVILLGEGSDKVKIDKKIELPVWIDGGDGDDYLKAGGGDDTLYGGEGDDKIYGGRGDDTLYGGEGDDKIYGGRGNDHIEGGSGNDLISGSRGDDTL
ncbi:MAG: tandem-95 repeat protein, partial [Deltaproteobacteria bacterium]|nr:tandem-95 repeat protein [Deltaproteobacteria bacterium]